jgi:DNA-directed RNA polymerase subunit delta
MKLKNYSEEQIREMPLTEIAYLYISTLKHPVSFNKLVDIVFSMADISDNKSEKMGQFYTDLTVDGRFVTFSNGNWDLRYRHRFEAFDWEEELDTMELVDFEDDDEDENEQSEFVSDVHEDDYSDEDRLDVSQIIQKPDDSFDDDNE